MRKILMLMCGVVMMSSAVFADDTTTSETCADGAGTVVVGAVTGHKYCMSNNGMNYWNAVSWCDGLKRRLFDRSDCACSNTTSDCHNKCPELSKIWNTKKWVKTITPINSSYAYSINLNTGDFFNEIHSSGYSALCY